MAVSVAHASAEARTASTTSFSVSFTSATANNVLVLIARTSGTAINLPAGWTQIPGIPAQINGGVTAFVLMAYKVAAGGETSVTVTGNSGTMNGYVIELSGVDTTTPLDPSYHLAAFNAVQSSGTSLTSTSSAVGLAGSYVLAAAFRNANTDAAWGNTWTNSFTRQGTLNATSAIEVAGKAYSAADSNVSTAESFATGTYLMSLVPFKATATALPGPPTIHGMNQSGGTNSSGSTIPFTLPPGWSAGDVAYLWLAVGQTAAVAAPTGWTQIKTAAIVSGSQLYIWRRVLQGGDSGPTVTLNAAGETWMGGLEAFSNVDTTPEDDSQIAQGTTSGTTLNAPATTATATTNMLLTFYMLNLQSNRGSAPSGAMELQDFDFGTTLSLIVNAEWLSASGSVGARTETYASTLSGAYIAASILVRPKGPQFVSGSVSDSQRDIDNNFQDITLTFDQAVSDSSFTVGGAMNGFTIHYDDGAVYVGYTPTYRSGNGTTTLTVRVARQAAAYYNLDFAYSRSSGNLLSVSTGVEALELSATTLTNNLTVRVHVTIKDKNALAVANTDCKVALSAYNSGTVATAWMARNWKTVVTTDANGLLDFGMAVGSTSLRPGDTVYLSVFWPDSGPTQTLIWTYSLL